MGMLDLLETVGSERYPHLLAACRSGYERWLAWPEGDLEVLQIGRLLWKANYVARVSATRDGRHHAQRKVVPTHAWTCAMAPSSVSNRIVWMPKPAAARTLASTSSMNNACAGVTPSAARMWR